MQLPWHRLRCHHFPQLLHRASLCSGSLSASSHKPPPTLPDTLRNRNSWEHALRIFAHSVTEGDPSEAGVYGTAMRACERGRQWGKCLEIFGKLREHHRRGPLSASVCNVAIAACTVGSQWRLAIQLVAGEMLQMAVLPDVVSYNSTINACEKGSKWQHCIQLLTMMRPVDLSPDVLSYGATVSACAKGGDWARSLACVEEMEAVGLSLDVLTLSALLSAYRRGSAWEQGLNILMRAKSSLQFDAICYEVSLALCDVGGKWELGLNILEEMKQRNFAPSIASYCTVLGACERLGLHDTMLLESYLLAEIRRRALELLQPMEDSGSAKCGLESHVVHLVLAIDTLHRRERLDTFLESIFRDTAYFPVLTALHRLALTPADASPDAASLLPELKEFGGSLPKSLLATQCGLGAYFTVEMLVALQLGDGIAPWHSKAQAAVCAALVKDAASHKNAVPSEPSARRLFAWVSHAVVICADEATGRASQFIRSHGYSVAHGRHSWSTGDKMFPPIFAQKGRGEQHAERRALLRIAERLLAAGATASNATGTVRLYSAHTPCISCLATFCQFKALFPGIRLVIGFATWRETREHLERSMAKTIPTLEVRE